MADALDRYEAIHLPDLGAVTQAKRLIRPPQPLHLAGPPGGRPPPARRRPVMVEGDGARWPREAWDRARAKAKLPWCKLHTLRHTTATWLLMSGASIEDVRVIMGHASIVTTQRYAHVAENHARDVADRMAERWLS